jgi:hypothetical protein
VASIGSTNFISRERFLNTLFLNNKNAECYSGSYVAVPLKTWKNASIAILHNGDSWLPYCAIVRSQPDVRGDGRVSKDAAGVSRFPVVAGNVFNNQTNEVEWL